MISQYFLLCTLSILIVLMAPRYSYFRKSECFMKKSMFLLIPLHFLYVWVFVYAMVTHHGGFCTDERMYPHIINLANGLFVLLFIIIVILSRIKYQIDVELKDITQAHVDKRGGRKKPKTFDERTDRLMYFGIWCVILTLAFIVAT